MSAALSFALPSSAQQPTGPDAHQLSGMVFNKQGEPLVGAYVRVKHGKKTWTVQTDETGKYMVNLRPDRVGRFECRCVLHRYAAPGETTKTGVMHMTS